MPSAPDWQKKPTRPRGGISDARLALSRSWGSVLTMPRLCGPITRIPWARAAATSCPAACSPDPPVSTTRPCTPLARHCSTTSAISVGGTANTARSTSAGTSRIVGYAGTPAAWGASGCTG